MHQFDRRDKSLPASLSPNLRIQGLIVHTPHILPQRSRLPAIPIHQTPSPGPGSEPGVAPLPPCGAGAASTSCARGNPAGTVTPVALHRAHWITHPADALIEQTKR